MSCEQDMTFLADAGDVGMLQGAVWFQNHETLNDLQCFGFIWQKNHFMHEETSNSPWSLIHDSGHSSAFTEMSPYSEAFGQCIHTGSSSSQSSDLVGPGSGVGSWQQPVDKAAIAAHPEQHLTGCALGDVKGPKVADASNDPPPGLIRPKKDPPAGGCEKNPRRSRVSFVNTDHQGRKTKVVEKKKRNKRIVRERNRVSAAKCRDHKRDLANKLKFKVEEPTELHQELSLCCNEVKSEVIRLKTEILRHADCDCDVIRVYTSAEANKIVGQLKGDASFLDGCGTRPTPTTFNSDIGRW
ncbi:uncharacterized protein B0J16DRAFT_317595 [Fusarium flagelliforme]|uniref:uncharacterized protein n=1 Tax=Fusarium flagelliforme TaxID=2675880 RepID=UPI001E8D8281|nr:uncharacterized protein B0J16DRAFT_317595 [Fusarium flagelliforme]KAH7193947.1 hypothetical protein B0J16DRAFT_317595 [Fusarium flagelliforme]